MYITLITGYMAESAGKTVKKRSTKNYNVAYIRRKMKETCGDQYRISKDAPAEMSKAIDMIIRNTTLTSAEFAMNAGRATIKGKDVIVALKVAERSG